MQQPSTLSGAVRLYGGIALWQRWCISADSWLQSLMGRWGVNGVCLGAAVVIDCVALFLYSPPISWFFDGVPSGRVSEYIALTEDPFRRSDDAALAFRVTTPLAAWLFGLRGAWGLALPYLATLAFFFFVIKFIHRTTGDMIVGIGLALAFAAVPVGHMSNIWPGIADSVTNLLALLALFVVNPVLLSILIFAGLWNDERMALMLPGILLARWFLPFDTTQVPRRAQLLLAACLPVLAYGAMRAYFELFTNRSSSAAFLDWRPMVGNPYLPLGLFLALKGLWLLPVVAVAAAAASRWVSLVVVLLVMLMLPLVQIPINGDVNRSITIAFPAVIVSVIWLARCIPRSFRVIILTLAAVALLTPQYNVFAVPVLGNRVNLVKPLPLTLAQLPSSDGVPTPLH